MLSEMPEEWKSKIDEWYKYNQEFKTVLKGVAEPQQNTEYFIYQTLIGIWPLETLTTETLPPLVDRIWQYILKSIHEAKVYTTWIRPNLEYERAVEKFIRSILVFKPKNSFLESFMGFQKKISFLGKLNSLSATVIKISSLGVVDLYQGNETWNYTMVDPDNRRLVDFELRQKYLQMIDEKIAADNSALKTACSVNQENMEHLKFLYTVKGLTFRRKNKEIFTAGEYQPVESTHLIGEKLSNVRPCKQK